MDSPKPRILLVDDLVPMLTLYKHLLEGAGYEIESAADGLSAIESLERGRPDLLVTDLHMPGAGGDAVMEAGRRLYPDLKVIILSGEDSAQASDELKAAESLGPDLVLNKPIPVPALLKAVKGVL